MPTECDLWTFLESCSGPSFVFTAVDLGSLRAVVRSTARGHSQSATDETCVLDEH